MEVIGVFVDPHSVSDRCTRYADAYKFRLGNCLLIPVGYGGIVNHSSTPNLEKVVEDNRLFFQAIRQIQSGEELLVSYSTYAQQRFNLI